MQDATRDYFILTNRESVPFSLTEILLILIGILSSTMIVHYHWKRRRMYKMARKIAGTKCYPIIGSAHLFAGSTESKKRLELDSSLNFDFFFKQIFSNRYFICNIGYDF